VSPLESVSSLQFPSGFLFGGTGTGEIIIIFVVVLLLFGPRRLPEIARAIGKILSQIRNASNDFRSQIMKIEEDEPARHHAVDVQAEEIEEKPDSSGSSTDPDVKEGPGSGGYPA